MQSLTSVVLLLTLLILSAGCTPEPNHIEDTGSNTFDYDPEERGFNLCTVDSPLERTFKVTRSLTYATAWEAGAGGDAGAEAGVGLAKVKANAQISAKYGRTAGETETFEDEIRVVVPARSQQIWVFQWRETRNRGVLYVGKTEIRWSFPASLSLVEVAGYSFDCPSVMNLSDIADSFPDGGTS